MRRFGDSKPRALQATRLNGVAMFVDFIMPDLGLRRGGAWVSLWLVDVGAPILPGEGLLEVAADGVTIDLPAPVAGVLHEILVGEDEPLAAGRRLGVIAVADVPEVQSDREPFDPW